MSLRILNFPISLSLLLLICHSLGLPACSYIVLSFQLTFEHYLSGAIKVSWLCWLQRTSFVSAFPTRFALGLPSIASLFHLISPWPHTVCPALGGVPPLRTVCRRALGPTLHVISFIYCIFFFCSPNLAMKRFMVASSSSSYCCRAARLLWLICHYNYLCPRYYLHTYKYIYGWLPRELDAAPQTGDAFIVLHQACTFLMNLADCIYTYRRTICLYQW